MGVACAYSDAACGQFSDSDVASGVAIPTKCKNGEVKALANQFANQTRPRCVTTSRALNGCWTGRMGGCVCGCWTGRMGGCVCKNAIYSRS